MSAPVTVNVSELFAGNLAVHGVDVPVSQLEGKVVALYFSAHWCPPCRAFTPTLIAAYKAAKEAGLPFELVYVSSDRDEEGFDAYTEAMPWPAIKFSEEDARAHVKDEVFGIKGIPQLLVLSPQGKLLTNEGRNQVAKDKEAAIKAWCDAAAPAPAAEKKAEEFSTSEDF